MTCLRQNQYRLSSPRQAAMRHHFPNTSQKPPCVQSPHLCLSSSLRQSTGNWRRRTQLAMTGSRRKVDNSERSVAPMSGQPIFASAPRLLMPRRCASKEEEPTWAIRPTMWSMGASGASFWRSWSPPFEVMDNPPMLDLLWHTCFRWRLRPKQVTADSLYGTGENLKAIEEAHIRAYIPVAERGQHNMGYYGLAQFTYEASQDQYRCPQGHVLRPAYRMEGTQEIQYRADAAICNVCPVKAQCTESPRGRHVHRSFFADYVARVKGYQQTFAYQKAMNKRKVWVEPLFGEGKQWHGMRRFRLRRLWRVNCEALMIASGQNLKRLLQKRGWGRRPFPTEAVALRPPGDEEADVFSRNISLKNDRVSVAVASLVSSEVVRAFFEAQSSRFSLRNSTFVIFLWSFKYPFFPFYCFLFLLLFLLVFPYSGEGFAKSSSYILL